VVPFHSLSTSVVLIALLFTLPNMDFIKQRSADWFRDVGLLLHHVGRGPRAHHLYRRPLRLAQEGRQGKAGTEIGERYKKKHFQALHKVDLTVWTKFSTFQNDRQVSKTKLFPDCDVSYVGRRQVFRVLFWSSDLHHSGKNLSRGDPLHQRAGNGLFGNFVCDFVHKTHHDNLKYRSEGREAFTS
jgi:hypothetical protein